MPNPIQPTIIQGPAIIQHNGYSFYTKDGIKVNPKRNTFAVKTDMHGQIDERLKSDMVTLSFTPDGQIESLAKYFPFGPANIGQSLFAGGDKSVVIQTLAGKSIPYAKGAVSKFPQIHAKVTETLFGEMEITCLGKSATARTAADYWKTIASTAFADTSFDETLVKTGAYIATFGAAPYDAMGSMDGFMIDLKMDSQEVEADDVGIADIIIRGFTAACTFKPSNLTEGQLDTLLNWQGAGAILPGASLSPGATDLVIAKADSAFTCTLKNAGPKDAQMVYGMAKHQMEGLTWVSKLTFTGGVANPLWVFS